MSCQLSVVGCQSEQEQVASVARALGRASLRVAIACNRYVRARQAELGHWRDLEQRISEPGFMERADELRVETDAARGELGECVRQAASSKQQGGRA